MANLEFRTLTETRIVVLADFNAGETTAEVKCFELKCKDFRIGKQKALEQIPLLAVKARAAVVQALLRQEIGRKPPPMSKYKDLVSNKEYDFLPEGAAVEEGVVKKLDDGTIVPVSDAELETVSASDFVAKFGTVYAISHKVTLAAAPLAPVGYWYPIKFAHSIEG